MAGKSIVNDDNLVVVAVFTASLATFSFVLYIFKSELVLAMWLSL